MCMSVCVCVYVVMNGVTSVTNEFASVTKYYNVQYIRNTNIMLLMHICACVCVCVYVCVNW